MGVSEEWRAMLEMGRKDLRALVLFESAVDLADEIFGFHTQQAAEKALKAWISRLGGTYAPTHDLSKLIPILERLGIDVSLLWSLTVGIPSRSNSATMECPKTVKHYPGVRSSLR